MKITFALLAAFIGLSSYLLGGDGEPSTKFKIMTKRDTDKVDVKIEKDMTVFIVNSPFETACAQLRGSSRRARRRRAALAPFALPRPQQASAAARFSLSH